MGGSGEGEGEGVDGDGSQESPPENNQGNSDRGFPENTPIAEMTTEQQLAYYRYQNRKSGDVLKQFGGITPDQAKQAIAEAEELRQSKLSVEQRALEEATTKAAQSAAQEATAKWAPKVLRATASRFIEGERLESFLNVTDVNKFISDGELDEEAVVGHLTGLFGEVTTHRQWGQSGARPPAPSARDQGMAEAKRRGFITDKE